MFSWICLLPFSNRCLKTVQLPAQTATGIVVKEYAITDEINKKIQYHFKDNMFKFWYRFVPDVVGAIVRNHVNSTHYSLYARKFQIVTNPISTPPIPTKLVASPH